MATVLYPERLYPDEADERGIFPRETTIVMRDTVVLSDLSADDCAAVEGLMIFRQWVGAADIARMPRLRAIVRMGVGYDRIDRAAAAARGIVVCNVPDYGTTEVADHAIALMMALRRGLLMHHDAQRATPPAPWAAAESPLLRRLSSQVFGIVGLGRIGTAVALRAKALGFDVVFFDPYRSNGSELAIGVRRALSLKALLGEADVLSLHTPHTPETAGMIGAAELAMLPANAVLVSTARGTAIDIEALEAALRSGALAGAGLDVLPVEPPVEPIPGLLKAYRERADWTIGRVIITPHSAFLTPEAYQDIRIKSAETMRAALFSNRPQNVIAPDSY
jgi:phosphoglycerate dehydrogenase-like enzyme